MRERTRLDTAISGYLKLEHQLADQVGLIEMAEAEDDAAVLADAEKGLVDLHKEARRQEVEALLSGEADGNDTYLEVH